VLKSFEVQRDAYPVRSGGAPVAVEFDRHLAFVLRDNLVYRTENGYTIRVIHFDPNTVTKLHERSAGFAVVNGFNGADFCDAGIANATPCLNR